MKPRSSASVRVAMAVAVALLALAGVHGESAATNKITVSPALAEAVANGEVSELPAFTATPVESQWKDTSSGSTSGSATTTSAPSTITPVITNPVTSAPSSSSGEVAVDTFKSKDSLSGSKSGGSNGLLIGVGVVGAIAAVAMAVVYKRRTANAADHDDDDDQNHSQQHPQPSQGRGMFESADYTPGKPSVDGMLQDDRLTTGSSTMLPVFSAADRMDMSGGIVRLSSPFGASGARISSPAIRGTRSTDNIEFSTGSQRGYTTVSGFDGRSTAASSGETVVHIKQERAL